MSVRVEHVSNAAGRVIFVVQWVAEESDFLAYEAMYRLGDSIHGYVAGAEPVGVLDEDASVRGEIYLAGWIASHRAIELVGPADRMPRWFDDEAALGRYITLLQYLQRQARARDQGAPEGT